MKTLTVACMPETTREKGGEARGARPAAEVESA